MTKSEPGSQKRAFSHWVAPCLLLLTLIGVMVETGCPSGQQKQAPTTAPVIVRPYRRFVPIAHGQGFLSFPYWAFDTKTGQLCKTWSWTNPTVEKADASGDTSKLAGLDAAAAYTPTCKELWTAFPDEPTITALSTAGPNAVSDAIKAFRKKEKAAKEADK
jgi:hypothetical protein